MYTEDDLAAAVRTGQMTVADVVQAMRGEDIVVYPALNVTEETMTWADVEDIGAGSTLFADLTTAGASPEQMDEVGMQIERHRAAGHTLDKVFGWSDEATTPEGETVHPVLPLPGEGAPTPDVGSSPNE